MPQGSIVMYEFEELLVICFYLLHGRREGKWGYNHGSAFGSD
ncbi:hypothetical protein E6C60_3259 [Paenibacillus algicola]|uniref:Uncharacterized protein n=1 Tax=Paenibacillus algicola TaxID=2565926 RepID=A0A4P8XQ73_9BACL|nr:hypothetical protein E6C60_3259 [Paenibacillus algicola]